jgi:hypothetical protein
MLPEHSVIQNRFLLAHRRAAFIGCSAPSLNVKGGEPLVKTKIPFWGNARFWLVVVVAELILVSMLAPGWYVNGLRLLLQAFHVQLP